MSIAACWYEPHPADRGFSIGSHFCMGCRTVRLALCPPGAAPEPVGRDSLHRDARLRLDLSHGSLQSLPVHETCTLVSGTLLGRELGSADLLHPHSNVGLAGSSASARVGSRDNHLCRRGS